MDFALFSSFSLSLSRLLRSIVAMPVSPSVLTATRDELVLFLGPVTTRPLFLAPGPKYLPKVLPKPLANIFRIECKLN